MTSERAALLDVPDEARHWHESQCDRLLLRGPVSNEQLRILQNGAYLKAQIKVCSDWLRKTRCTVEIAERRRVQKRLDELKAEFRDAMKELKAISTPNYRTTQC